MRIINVMRNITVNSDQCKRVITRLMRYGPVDQVIESDKTIFVLLLLCRANKNLVVKEWTGEDKLRG